MSDRKEKSKNFKIFLKKVLNNTITVDNFFEDENYYELWRFFSKSLEEHSKLLFAVKESNFKIQRDKTKIAEYVKNKMQLRQNMQHMIFKNRNYFYSPVLTIIIKGNIDNEIYHESQQIVQGIYSLIRINDLLNDSRKSGWNSFVVRRHPVTYAVYNKCGKKNCEIDGGCGHQMKIFRSLLHDVGTVVFLQNKSVLVDRFDYLIKSIFESKMDGIDKIYYAKKR